MFRKLWSKISHIKDVLGRMGKYGRLFCLTSVLTNVVAFMTSTSIWQWVWIALAAFNALFLAGDLVAVAYWTFRRNPEAIALDALISWWCSTWRDGHSVRALKRIALSGEERRRASASQPSSRQRIIEVAERLGVSDAVLEAALRRQASGGVSAAMLFFRLYKEECHALLKRAEKVGILPEAEQIVCQSTNAEMHHNLRSLVERAEESDQEKHLLMEQAKRLAMEVQIQVNEALAMGDREKARALIAAAKPRKEAREAKDGPGATVTPIKGRGTG